MPLKNLFLSKKDIGALIGPSKKNVTVIKTNVKNINAEETDGVTNIGTIRSDNGNPRVTPYGTVYSFPINFPYIAGAGGRFPPDIHSFRRTHVFAEPPRNTSMPDLYLTPEGPNVGISNSLRNMTASLRNMALPLRQRTSNINNSASNPNNNSNNNETIMTPITSETLDAFHNVNTNENNDSNTNNSSILEHIADSIAGSDLPIHEVID